MADFYPAEQPASSSPTVQRPANANRAKARRSISTFVCNAAGVGGAAAGSRLMLPLLPKGAKGVHYRVTVSATLATATLAIGIAGTTNKYGAAATYTAADAPATVAKATLIAAELAADEQPFITTAVAALPNGGETIVVETLYSLVS